MCAAFRTTDPLIVGCRSGSRARAALEELLALGFVQLAQLRHGFEGARDDFGRRLPGWIHSGIPVETGEPAPQYSYAGLCARYLELGEQG